jgi:hypothetical protein
MQPNCPDDDNTAGWLFLMQHYGLPTRIMDWTSSILVATYFAIRHEEDDGNDGAVWALYPSKLNEKQGQVAGMPTVDEPLPAAIFESVLTGNIDPDNEIAIAISGYNNDIRMMVQHAEFSLHGVPTPLEELANCEDFLLKFVIPACSKPNLKVLLKQFGFSEASMFPDLEHLAKDVANMTFQP